MKIKHLRTATVVCGEVSLTNDVAQGAKHGARCRGSPGLFSWTLLGFASLKTGSCFKFCVPTTCFALLVKLLTRLILAQIFTSRASFHPVFRFNHQTCATYTIALPSSTPFRDLFSHVGSQISAKHLFRVCIRSPYYPSNFCGNLWYHGVSPQAVNTYLLPLNAP